jgi:nucleotide-binding universal stress UspA family protein
MSAIVCATRGGPGSRLVKQRALEYAGRGDRRLVFLYVVDTPSLGEIAPALRAAAEEELSWIGHVVLTVAQQLAASHGIAAEIVVRRGDPLSEIIAQLNESEADLLLLGAPRPESIRFGDADAMERVVQRVQQESGARVEVVWPGPPGAAGA